jgi:hypothetical protein
MYKIHKLKISIYKTHLHLYLKYLYIFPVSFNVQLAAASALLDMVTADPVKITPVLEHWSDRGSKGTLTAQFARRMKEIRAHTWSNILL